MGNYFDYWVISIFAGLPSLNFMLYVLSRGTSHYQSLIPIIFPFITLKREVCISDDQVVMKIKQYWLIAEEFVVCLRRCCDRRRKLSRLLRTLSHIPAVWHIALWFLTWILINVFVKQFVNRGIIERRKFVGVIPNGWVCYVTSNLNIVEWIFSPCLNAVRATDDVAISATDTLYCFKLQEATLSSDSDLKEAFSVSLAIYLFALAVLRVGFKLLAGLCTSRKEEHLGKTQLISSRTSLPQFCVSS